MPFRYLRRANNQSYAIIITIEWLILGAYSLLPFLRVLTGSDFFKIAFSLMGFIITMFLVIYAKISRIVESHRRKIRPSVKLTTATNIPSSGAPASHQRCSTHSRELRAESKKAHTIAIVVFVTVICYSPLAAIFVLRGIYGDTYVLVNIADPWADLIMFINSMVNPIIYCLRTKEIRDAAVKVLPERLASLLKEAWLWSQTAHHTASLRQRGHVRVRVLDAREAICWPLLSSWTREMERISGRYLHLFFSYV